MLRTYFPRNTNTTRTTIPSAIIANKTNIGIGDSFASSFFFSLYSPSFPKRFNDVFLSASILSHFPIKKAAPKFYFRIAPTIQLFNLQKYFYFWTEVVLFEMLYLSTAKFQ